ncbi:MAG: hypothetical protein GPJ54_15565 [Candidatus Heimdallarchaeota archaeon]|nr:hypothetical protein [Candidatus Heimdallarchaeota archaeon]
MDRKLNSKKYFSIGILVVLLSLGNVEIYANTNSQQQNPSLKYTYEKIPEIPKNVNFDLNILFLGFEETRINLPKLQTNLPKWTGIIDRVSRNKFSYSNISSLKFFQNFTISYTFEFAEKSVVEQYAEYIENQVTDLPPNYSEHQWVNYIPSVPTENYFRNNIILGSKPTLLLIDTYTYDPINFIPHFYYQPMWGRQYTHGNPASYEIAGGGKESRFVWLDLSAGPANYSQDIGTPNSLGANNETITPIWDYETSDNSRLTSDISKYIKSAIEFKFLPSFGQTPLTPDEVIKFEYVKINIGNPSTDYYDKLDNEYILREYKQFNPMINWDYEILDWVWNEDSRFEDLMYDQLDSHEQVLKISRNTHIFLKAYSDRVFSKSTPKTNIIPIFLIGLPKGYIFFEEAWNLKFQAASYDDGESSPTYIIMGANDFNYQTEMVVGESRSTIITMHEIGHFLGLLHPFDAMIWKDIGGNAVPIQAQNWLWDFTYTQMSYLGAYPELSKMDIDTLMRGEIIEYLDNLIFDLEEDLPKLDKYQNSEQLFEYFNSAVNSIGSSLVEYQSYETLNNYNISLSYVFDGINALDNFTKLYNDLESDNDWTFQSDTVILFSAIGMIGIFATYIFILKKRKY